MRYPIPYRKGDKWGFCDSGKNIIINCVYDNVSLPFSPENFDLALVRVDKKYCWINTQGKQICPFADQINPFIREEISVILLDNENSNNKKLTDNCLFINSKGENVFTIAAITAHGFQGGQCIVQFPNNLYGAINIKGEITVQPFFGDYNTLWHKMKLPYYDRNEIPREPQPLIKFEQNRYFGFKDEEGNVVLEPKYTFASDFDEGVAMVGHTKSFYHIDLNGKRLYDKVYYDAFNYSYGVAKVVTTTHDDVNPYVHERWGVEYYIPGNAKWGYIDKAGNEYWDDI